MRQVNFDYANTCPTIDAAISRAKDEMASFIDDILSDACGLLESRQREELAREYADALYQRIEDAFEEARSSNEKMRDAADDQISDLKDEIENLQSELRQAQERIEA